MARSDPSILAIASKLRGVTFNGVECGSVDGKGWGLTTTRDLTTKDVNIGDLPKLITIPHDLVLNQQAVEEYAKESLEFRELYEAVGRQVLQTLACDSHLYTGLPGLPQAHDLTWLMTVCETRCSSIPLSATSSSESRFAFGDPYRVTLMD